MPESKWLFELWREVRYQHIMGPVGAVDLNLLAVFKAVEVAGVEDAKETVALLHNVYRAVLAKMAKAASK